MQECLGQKWANTIIEQLILEGHTYFCISPGSRSTPLVLAISALKNIDVYVYHDERALGFHALGYSMSSLKAPVIVVTSGTACGNLLPSIMEAFSSSIPLIILTADRPYELQNCGANQTTHQTDLFDDYVISTINLPSPDEIILKNALAHIIHKGCSDVEKSKLPLHINIPFREPFSIFHNTPSCFYSKSLVTWQGEKTLTETQIKELTSLLSQKKGLLILGRDALTSKEPFCLDPLIKQLNYTLFIDPLSCYPFKNKKLANLFFKLLNRSLDPEALSLFDVVLHIGKSLISKQVTEYLAKNRPSTYIHVDPSEKRYDPNHLVTHKIEIRAKTFSTQLLKHLPPTGVESLDTGPCLHELVKPHVIALPLSEGFFFWNLSYLDLSNWNLFLGNSMPIRDFHDFYHSSSPPKRIFCNRGLSGIDGNIATCCGLANQGSSPLLAIIGDQTCLHDASSIIQLAHLKNPVLLIVLNNSGGCIFSHLPISQNKEICARFFINPHTLSFAKIGASFGANSYHFASPIDFFREFESLSQKQVSAFVEIKTCNQQNLQLHQSIKNFSFNHVFSTTWQSQ